MPNIDAQYSYNFIDLFAGAGGLSEGFLQAGFKPVAHVEMNEFASKTLETRSAYYYLKGTENLGLYKKYVSGKMTRDDFMKQIPASITKTIINETMSDETLPAIFKTIDGIMKIRGINKIDVIVGGPPCQAYSLVGRAQSSHMEVPMAEDPRNYLYKLYARFLKRYQPRMFVFENVTGIESANGGATWKNIQKYLKRVGYEIECREQKAVDWQGGGGYHFYELAPSLLVKNDKLPIYQINPTYTFEMLCEAICKIEGFRYKPEDAFHGHSSEKRYIHITTEFINAGYIKSLSAHLAEGQSLLIYGTKIQSDMVLPDNIEVKKIPKDLLEKCDFESEVQ